MLCSLKQTFKSYTAGLPEFQWSDLVDKEEIGRGTYGTVLLANNQTTSEKVVVKKLIVSSRADDKQRFFKEAMLL